MPRGFNSPPQRFLPESPVFHGGTGRGVTPMPPHLEIFWTGQTPPWRGVGGSGGDPLPPLAGTDPPSSIMSRTHFFLIPSEVPRELKLSRVRKQVRYSIPGRGVCPGPPFHFFFKRGRPPMPQGRGVGGTPLSDMRIRRVLSPVTGVAGGLAGLDCGMGGRGTPP